MPAINEVTNLEVESNIAVLTLNSPPVNALSASVREGLHDGVKQTVEDESIRAVVLICEGRTFIAGADITEFGQAPKGPSLFDVLDMIENSPKPVISAIHGTALGGGGSMSTMHVVNFFETIRGKEKLNAPIDDASISMAMVHYANVAYRIGKGFKINNKNGRMLDENAMKLWGREYEKGWEPTL